MTARALSTILSMILLPSCTHGLSPRLGGGEECGGEIDCASGKPFVAIDTTTPTARDRNATGVRKGPYNRKLRVLKKRFVFINGEISRTVYEAVIKRLFYLESLSSEPIVMLINSKGGTVVHGFGIIDTMQILTSPVYTVGIGSVKSMGAVIFMSGTRRFLTPHCQVLLHEIRYSPGNSRHTDHLTHSKYAGRLNNQLLSHISSHSLLGKRSLKRMFKTGDRYFTPDECVTMGLADQVIRNLPELLQAT